MCCKLDEYIAEKSISENGFSNYKKQIFTKNAESFKENAIQIIGDIYLKEGNDGKESPG